MSIESPNNNRDQGPKINRRDFLRMGGSAVGAYALSSVSSGELQEAVANTITTESGETIPSQEGLRKVFETLCSEVTKVTGVENYTETRKAGYGDTDVYLWEMEFPIKDGTAEFGYMRKGRHPIGGSASFTKIYITFYNEQGMPENGYDIAEFNDGKWVISDLELPE